jgi:hypothetical protein
VLTYLNGALFASVEFGARAADLTSVRALTPAMRLAVAGLGSPAPAALVHRVPARARRIAGLSGSPLLAAGVLRC